MKICHSLFIAMTAVAVAAMAAGPAAAQKKYGPGVSDTEIKIGKHHAV
jgi:branched-chain amino acid transport system substrate-binding protein